LLSREVPLKYKLLSEGRDPTRLLKKRVREAQKVLTELKEKREQAWVIGKNKRKASGLDHLVVDSHEAKELCRRKKHSG